MTTRILTNSDNVLELIRRLIAEDDIEGAVAQIIAIEGMERQLNIVFALIHSLTRALDTVLERARKRARDRELARDLSLVRALTRALDRDLAHARARAFYLARSLARDPVRTRSIYNALELDLVLVRALSLDLDLGLVREGVLEHDPQALELIQQEHNTVKVIIQVLEFAPADAPEQFALVGLPFTPANLTMFAAPFLDALTEIQRVIANMRGKEFDEPQISMMSAGSFDVRVIGLSDAIHTTRKILQSYKRKQESKAQDLVSERTALQSEIDALNAERWMKEDEIERNPTLKVDAKEQHLTKLADLLRQREQDLQKRGAALSERERNYHKAQMYSYRILANSFVDVVAPMLNAEQRAPYIPRLVKEFKVVADSPLQLHIGAAGAPPPPR
jgi:hypothetical protein